MKRLSRPGRGGLYSCERLCVDPGAQYQAAIQPQRRVTSEAVRTASMQ